MFFRSVQSTLSPPTFSRWVLVRVHYPALVSRVRPEVRSEVRRRTSPLLLSLQLNSYLFISTSSSVIYYIVNYIDLKFLFLSNLDVHFYSSLFLGLRRITLLVNLKTGVQQFLSLVLDVYRVGKFDRQCMLLSSVYQTFYVFWVTDMWGRNDVFFLNSSLTFFPLSILPQTFR